MSVSLLLLYSNYSLRTFNIACILKITNTNEQEHKRFVLLIRAKHHSFYTSYNYIFHQYMNRAVIYRANGAYFAYKTVKSKVNRIKEFIRISNTWSSCKFFSLSRFARNRWMQTWRIYDLDAYNYGHLVEFCAGNIILWDLATSSVHASLGTRFIYYVLRPF